MQQQTPSPEPLPVRYIEVTAVRRLSPHLVRITFGGPDLAGFRLDAPDQQVKLYFPRHGQRLPRLPEASADGDLMRWYQAFRTIPEDERPWTRSYTVRAHHPETGTIDIDFVLHGTGLVSGAGSGSGSGPVSGPDGSPVSGSDGGPDGGPVSGSENGSANGPATRWAHRAAPGDTLGMFGPSAYFARPVPLGTADWMLLAGDETALPAIGTLAEWLPEGARAVAYIEVTDAADEQTFDTRGDLTVHWLHRGTGPAAPGEPLVEAVRGARFPAGSVFAWLAGEAGAVRALRRHLVEDRGLDKRDIDFTGYWRRALTQDDAPTEDDLADARERLADAQ
ncbi:siderophore-interacting protein [Streptomyces paromomycinus]|uniref:Siderophore-interacting protein n=1 Tax=Streptomyces paromomycinus TaxID=92743 RepID=A0A401VWZ6_STREY|nr:siderophore-interacting protein [Streptomyces paromomycinus]GCD41588.1 siderophore-interacting protein [Streptomyces paromomycinus]